MAPEAPRRVGHRLLLLLLAVALVAAACGGADAGPNAASTTSTTDAPATTDTVASSTTSESTTSTTEATTTTSAPEEVDSGLPLLPTTTTAPPNPPVDPPLPPPVPGPPPGRNSVFVLGDSVFLGTTSSIPSALPEWLVTYDAVGSRRLAQGIDVLAMRRGEIGEAVVVHLGNNYIEGERGDYASQIDEAMTVLADVPRVVWVTVSEVSDSRRQINVAIRDAAARWPNMRVADWAPVIAAEPGLAWDGMHLTPEGRRRIAELIAQTLGPVVAP
ncbi:SGNH/GDSL hydrolase family protein [Actinomarinicola tropica]|uniref:hypothetical protein n=1 Tax=Actinomarinicola tropica TaxID=2789776 RepID=UPI001E580E9E|nr:hypothetical protein [Actinomarinicola tropica]